jgi:transcriptional regulator
MAPNRLYIPQAFKASERQLLDLVAAVGVGHLVTCGDEGIDSTFLPVYIDETDGVVRGHFSRGNPHWRTITSGTEALLIVTGVDNYVSPSWYPTKARTGEVVPTWNYELVHVRGPVRIVDDHDFVEDVVRNLTERHESPLPTPWSVDDAPTDYLGKMLAAIVGVEITIESVTGKRKLSQNRPDEDRLGVIDALASGSPSQQLAAAAMPRPNGAPSSP